MKASLVVLIALALAGCEYVGRYGGAFVAWIVDHGDVYECRATAADVLELCTELDEDELERATGWECWDTTRAWPRVMGCIYCCGPTCGRGCNAHHGCFCPE